MQITKHIIRAFTVSSQSLVILGLLIACLLSPSYAQTAASNDHETATTSATEAKLRATVINLESIQKSIELKQGQLRELNNNLAKTKDPLEKQELEKKISDINSDITDLRASFENITLGGITRSILNDQPEQPINWQDELEQVIRPLLSTVKEFTAKPRKIDTLRRESDRLQAQIKAVDKALDSINSFKSQELPPAISKQLDLLLTDWQQRKVDTQRKLEVSQYKLNSLLAESDSWQVSTGELIKEFLRGRGLTLFYAIVVGLLVWLTFKGLLTLFWRWYYNTKLATGIRRAPLLYYGYRLTMLIFILFAVLLVFYVRGDVLLLTLALIALVGAALALRQTLPRYAAEVRLLLGVGPVREKERLILDGIPFKVDSLSVYTELRNPELEGFIRLPLHKMDEMVSRPVNKEPWFPCRAGDFVLLASGSLARVIRQTVELVEVAVMDTIMQMSTRALLEQNVRNLSREGFGISCLFGVDYQHQAICLDVVADKLKADITSHFERSGMKDDIKEIMVEFSSAGASSLDYRIYLILNGSAAKAYYKAQRLVAQACVATCNREGWIIPFTQVTVHTVNDSTQ